MHAAKTLKKFNYNIDNIILNTRTYDLLYTVIVCRGFKFKYTTLYLLIAKQTILYVLLLGK